MPCLQRNYIQYIQYMELHFEPCQSNPRSCWQELMTPDRQPLADGATECAAADVPKSTAPGTPQTARRLTRSKSCLGDLEQAVLGWKCVGQRGIGGVLRQGHFSYGLYLANLSAKLCETLWKCGRKIGTHDSTHFQRLHSSDDFLRPRPCCCRGHVESCACQRPATRVWKAGLHDWSFWETRNAGKSIKIRHPPDSLVEIQ